MAEQQESSWLATIAKYTLVGGAAVAGIAYGGEALGDALVDYGKDASADEFWKNTASSVGESLQGASNFVSTAGNKIAEHAPEALKEMGGEHNSKLFGIMAGGMGAAALAGLTQLASDSPAQLPPANNPGRSLN